MGCRQHVVLADQRSSAVERVATVRLPPSDRSHVRELARFRHVATDDQLHHHFTLRYIDFNQGWIQCERTDRDTFRRKVLVFVTFYGMVRANRFLSEITRLSVFASSWYLLFSLIRSLPPRLCELSGVGMLNPLRGLSSCWDCGQQTIASVAE